VQKEVPLSMVHEEKKRGLHMHSRGGKKGGEPRPLFPAGDKYSAEKTDFLSSGKGRGRSFLLFLVGRKTITNSFISR